MTGFITRNEDLFRVLAAFITAQIASLLLMYLFSGLAHDNNIYGILLNVIGTLAVNVVVFVLFCGRVKLPKKADGYSHIEPMLFFFSAVFLACVAAFITKKLLPSSVDVSAFAQPSEFAVYAVYTVILAPIAEELAFRGAVLTALEKRSSLISTLISAVVFAAYHMNPTQFPYTFILGFFLAVLARRSGRLLPCVFVHAANNTLTLAASCSDTVSRITDIALPILGTVSLAWLIFSGKLFNNERNGGGK